MGLTPACDTIATINISSAEDVQELPDVSFGDGIYCVVWADSRDGSGKAIRAARVTPQWAVLDTGIVVDQNSTQQNVPAIAFDGSRFLVVWQNLAAPFGVYARFLGTDAQPQDTIIAIAESVTSTYPRIAFGDASYLVVWQEYTVTNDIVGQIISSAGSFIGDTILIATGSVNQVSPTVCFDGTNYLVLWAQDQIWGQFISSTGSLIGGPFPISVSTYPQINPGIAYGDGTFFAAWSEFRTDYDIYGNLDVQFSVMEFSIKDQNTHVYPERTLVTEKVKIANGSGREIILLDAFGRRIMRTQSGYFDMRDVVSGVYFVYIEKSTFHKIVKIH